MLIQERPKRPEFVTRPWERMPYGLFVPELRRIREEHLPAAAQSVR